MSKVNELNIEVKTALITKVAVELNDDGEPSVWLEGTFITKQGQTIGSFHYMSNHWQKEQKLEVPVEAHIAARHLFEALTPVVLEKIQGKFKTLPAKI